MSNKNTTPKNKSTHPLLIQIKDLLKRMESENVFVEFDKHQGSRQLKYKPEPRLTTSEIESWEAANGISLPEEYRLYLNEIGNGGKMPSAYCDFVLKSIDINRVNSGLQKPFPITKDRLEQRLTQPRPGENNEGPFLSELGNRLEDELPSGCLYLGRYPSYDSLFLVINGELQGTVWIDMRGGIPELDAEKKPVNFLDWLLDVLTELYETNL